MVAAFLVSSMGGVALGQSLTGMMPNPMQTSRDGLYGDVPLEEFAAHGTAYPWTSLRDAAHAIKTGDRARATSLLRRVAVDASLEARLRLEAWTALRALGVTPTASEGARLEGVVVDVGLRTGLDTLAVYSDNSAVYINDSAKAIYIAPGAALGPEINTVLAAGRRALPRIGPFPGPRPAVTGAGTVRVALLSAQGLSFAQGPMKGISRDRLAGPVFNAAAALLQKMVALRATKQ
jgi:hypothetical protein